MLMDVGACMEDRFATGGDSGLTFDLCRTYLVCVLVELEQRQSGHTALTTNHAILFLFLDDLLLPNLIAFGL